MSLRWDDDFLGLISDELLDIGVGKSKFGDFVGVVDFVEIDSEARAQFAVDLNDEFDGITGKILGVVGGPSVVST